MPEALQYIGRFWRQRSGASRRRFVQALVARLPRLLLGWMEGPWVATKHNCNRDKPRYKRRRSFLLAWLSNLWAVRSACHRRSLRLEWLEDRAVPAFVINPTFASNITSDPNAATIMASINRVIAAYGNAFSDNVSVNITFQEGSGLGASSTAVYSVSYASYHNQLIAHATTADDSTALANVPSTNPITGTLDTQVRVPSALANTLGLAPGVNPDSTITLNTSLMNLDRTGTYDPTKYDLMKVTAHEIDEALSLGSGLDGLANGGSISNTRIKPADLFRYASAGVRSFDTQLSTQAFFSIDGGNTMLARFNQTAGGDFGDWYSPGGQTPQVQDAFDTKGSRPNLNVELRRLDVVGYTRVAPTTLSLTPPPIQNFAAGVSTAFSLGSISNGNGPFGVTVNWGDGSANTTFYVNNIGSLGSQNHTYISAGNYTPTISVTDFTSQTGSTSFTTTNTASVSVAGGNAVFTGTTGNDPITLAVNGLNYRFSDANGLLAGPGATQTNSTTVDVPISSVTGSVQINANAGNDTLTVDSSAGDPFPSGGLTFHGGGQSGDKLITTGNPGGTAYSKVISNYLSASPAFAGNIVFLGNQTDTLNYDGVQSPIDISGSAATNIVFNLPAIIASSSAAVLQDDGVTGNGIAQLRSSNGTFATTVFTSPSLGASLSGGSVTIIRASALDTVTVNNLSSGDFWAGLTIGAAGAEFNSVTFTGGLTLAPDNSLSANATGAISLPNSTSDVAVSGTGSISLTTATNISLGTGSSITSVNGNITLAANQQATPTGGSFVGVTVLGGIVQSSGAGTVSIIGRGGNGAGSQDGIFLLSGAVIQGGTGGLQITGQAGAATSTSNDGVTLYSSVLVTALGNGPVTVHGTGGGTSGGLNAGVDIDGNSTITSSGGNVQVIGQGGGSDAANFGSNGIFVLGASVISAGGNGRVTVQGAGGPGLANQNHGVEVSGSGSAITSSGGDIQVTGVGGGSATSGFNTGVLLASSAQISAGGNGAISIQGTGGFGSGNTNYGVYLLSTPSVTAGGGAIQFTGIEGAGTSGIAVSVSSGSVSTAGSSIDLIGNSINFGSTATITANSVMLRPATPGVGINLGPASDPLGGPLSLSNAEFSRISANTISIGDGNSGSVTISAAIALPAGSTTAVDLGTGGNNNILFTGNGSLDAKNGNVTLATNTSGTGAITSGSTAVDVKGATVSLIAGSGGIGTSGNPLVIAATTLDATTGGNGNHYLSASGATTIDAIGLSAGAGTIELDGGTFTLGGNDRIDDNTNLNINGATFDVSSFNERVGGVTLTSGSITGTTGVLTSATTYQTQSGSISAILAGSNATVGLTQSGSSTTTLSGANTYAGDTTIQAGSLKLGAANAIPSGSGKGNVVFNPASGTATFDVAGFSPTVNGLSSSGGGASIVDNSATGGPFTLSVGAGDATSTFSGVIQNTAGTLAISKIGAGTLTLAGANTYSGDTTITAGTLKLGAADAIPSGTAKGNVVLNPTSGNAAKLDIAGFSPTINGLSSGGTGSSVVDNSATGGPFTLSIGANDATSTFAGTIGNAAGTVNLVKIGAGTLTLSGINRYSGSTTVSQGKLTAADGIAIPDVSDLTVALGATFDLARVSLAGGFLNETVGGLNGEGLVTVSNQATLVVTSGGHFSGTASNSLTLDFVAPSKTLIFDGTFSGSGFLFIGAGTFVANGTFNGSGVDVFQDATLEGSGTFNTFVQVLGHLAPGVAGAGVIRSPHYGYVFRTGSSFDADLNGIAAGTQYDQATGGFTEIDGNVSLNMSLGFAPAAGSKFAILTSGATSLITGRFAGLPQGQVFSVTSASSQAEFQINYPVNDGNPVVLTAIDTSYPILEGTDGSDLWLVKRNGDNDDITLNGNVIWSTPVGSLTSLTINGLAGNDTLNVDLSAGNPFPTGGINFNGGDSFASPGDRLIITGGDQGTVTYNYTDAHDGSVVMNNYGTLSYADTESIVNSGSAADVVFNLPIGPNAVTLGDDGTTGNQLSRISAPTIATTDFADPSGTLSINAGHPADTLTLNALPDFSAGLALGTAANPFSSLQFTDALTLASDKSLAAYASGSISLASAATVIATSGTGSVSLTTARDIGIASGANISTVNGGIILSANQQVPRSSGDFAGISLGGTLTTTGTGSISLAGTAGDDATTASHRGVDINGGTIRSTANIAGAGTITINGTGGAGTEDNSGVVLSAGDVESVAGDIQIIGDAGVGSTVLNRGIAVLSGGQVKSTGTGAAAAGISLMGSADWGTDSNYGVEVFGANSAVTSVDGGILIGGSGGAFATGSFNYGTVISAGAVVKSLGLGSSVGDVIIYGQGGGNGSLESTANDGLRIEGATTEVDTADANLDLSGVGGSAAQSAAGVALGSSAAINVTGSGRLAVTGSGGLVGSDTDSAIRVLGAITANGPNTTLQGNKILIDSISASINVGANLLYIIPNSLGRAIELGADDTVTQLGLTDSELSRITAGTLEIGDANSGPLTISGDVSRAMPTTIYLGSHGAIAFSGGSVDTDGGNLVIMPGPSGVSFPHPGLDVNVGPTGVLSFSVGTKLVMAINGLAPDAEYDQLNVVGQIDLTGVNLVLSGTLAHAIANQFTLISNDGIDVATGTFDNVGNNLLVIPFGTQAGNYTVDYAGGDGNDVLLTAVNAQPTFTGGSDQAATDEDSAQIIPQWAQDISAGFSPDEGGQKVQFVITTDVVASTDNKPLFVAGPAIDPDTGDLTFTPNPNVVGTAQITATLMDDAGVAGGGTDTSDAHVFTIQITKAHVWHNALKPSDVTGDGQVVPNDIVALIIFLNGYGATNVPKDGRGGGPYCDVDADGVVAPKDIVDVIIHLNAFGAGEAEATVASTMSVPPRDGDQSTTDALYALLAADSAVAQKRRH